MSASTALVLALSTLWIVAGGIAAWLARRRGHGWLKAVVLGLLLGPVGLLVGLGMGVSSESSGKADERE